MFKLKSLKCDQKHNNQKVVVLGDSDSSVQEIPIGTKILGKKYSSIAFYTYVLYHIIYFYKATNQGDFTNRFRALLKLNFPNDPNQTMTEYMKKDAEKILKIKGIHETVNCIISLKLFHE